MVFFILNSAYMIFNKTYFILAGLFFVTEVLIALFVHDGVIRPYGGDFLVVILLYCIVKAFFPLSVIKTSIAVLGFSFLIELLQYNNFIAHIGLENSDLARTVIGNSYEWIDLLAYVLGIATVIITEFVIGNIKTQK